MPIQKKSKSVYYSIPIDKYGNELEIHINYSDKGIEGIFLRKTPIGDEYSSLVTFCGILLTQYFKLNGSIEKLFKHLHSIKSTPVRLDDGTVIESIPHAIANVLKDFLKEHKFEQITEVTFQNK